MLHAFPRTFELPERRADRAHSTVLPPLTAPDYLRLRRKAAGLSIAAVAKRLHEAHRAARPAMRLEWAASVVTLLETRGITARYAEALDALSAPSWPSTSTSTVSSPPMPSTSTPRAPRLWR